MEHSQDIKAAWCPPLATHPSPRTLRMSCCRPLLLLLLLTLTSAKDVGEKRQTMGQAMRLLADIDNTYTDRTMPRYTMLQLARFPQDCKYMWPRTEVMKAAMEVCGVSRE